LTDHAPRLSIVIPCFNSEATIGAQLSALADQTTQYWWEVLVSDNGSRDNTLAIATRFRDRIERLLVEILEPRDALQEFRVPSHGAMVSRTPDTPPAVSFLAAGEN